MRTFPTLAVFLLGASALLSGCTGDGDDDQTITDTPCSQLIGEADGTSTAHTVVQVTTSMGAFRIELFDDKTPITVGNFKKYVNDGFYDNTLFHRIIKDFMIQGGGMNTDGQMKETTYPPIKNEARDSGCLNKEYTVSMARTNQPDSATSQFFVNTADNPFLDPNSRNPAGYAVFGVVISGRDVVDQIESVPVEPYAPGKRCQQDSQPSCPKEPVVVQTIEVV